MSAPLTGTRVLDLSRLYPGAFTTLLLADLGADVLKVESPGYGDGMRFLSGGGFEAAHAALNRGKRSMTLDLRGPRGAEVFRMLARDADVVVESHRPGALAKSGIGYEQIRVDNPGVVWCAITGFGQDGPNANAPGHDITYLGAAGVLGRLGGESPPVPQLSLSLPIGALVAVSGILASLTARARTGEGAFVDTSLVEAAMWTMSEDVARASTAPGPDWGSFAARNVYRCADGRYVTVAATEAKSWAALCAALHLDDLAEHRHGVDEPATVERLSAAFATRPAAAWVADPGFAGGVGPVNDATDLLHDAHVAARHGVVPLDDTSTTRVVASPVRVDGSRSDAAFRPAPDLGAHTDEALRAAGLSDDEIGALRRDGIV
jgi:alpha-methylacyl-CoA racemase